jgi:aquaporin Z
MGGSMGPKLIAEFVGTFLLIFTVGCNVLSQNAVFGGVSIACVLMVCIYAFGCVSGGNFNPAVSFGLALLTAMGHRPELREKGGQFTWSTFAVYSGVQIVAGILAGVAYTMLFWDSFNLAPAKDFGWVNAGLAEFLYTFVLVFVVLNVAASRAADADKNEYYGLAIGFVVVAGAYGAGAVSGGCFNPAVAIGIDLASWNLGFFWSMVYVGWEIAGAALACVLFMVCRPEEFRIMDRMDGLPPERKIGTKMASEFIGTYILVLTVGLNVLAASQAAAFSIAASLMCAIFALGNVSGAHFNPAVTIAVMAAGATSAIPPEKKFPLSEVSSYIAAQVAGGVAAAGTYVLIYVGRSFPLGGDAELSSHKWGQIFVAELVFTFTLCLVVLCVAASEHNSVKNYFGLAIGSCVTVGGFAIGGISGGSLNPAVSFGIGTGAGLTTSFSLFQQLFRALMYSLIEIMGGLLAAAVFVNTHGAMPDPLLADSEKRAP